MKVRKLIEVEVRKSIEVKVRKLIWVVVNKNDQPEVPPFPNAERK